MKERDAQIEFQKSRIKSDKKWEDQLKVNIAKAFKEEQEKAEKRHRERIALAKDHLKQYVHISYLFYGFLFSHDGYSFFLIMKVMHVQILRRSTKAEDVAQQWNIA
jgi:hypothetical protein